MSNIFWNIYVVIIGYFLFMGGIFDKLKKDNIINYA